MLAQLERTKDINIMSGKKVLPHQDEESLWVCESPHLHNDDSFILTCGKYVGNAMVHRRGGRSLSCGFGAWGWPHPASVDGCAGQRSRDGRLSVAQPQLNPAVRIITEKGVSSMALIENLEHEGWEDFLRNCFRFTLEVLREDRFRSLGSSADDLRNWLTTGGVARVRYHLGEQMRRRGLSTERQAGINRCIDDLVEQHRVALFDLMAKGIIPGSTQECLASCGFAEEQFGELIDRLVRGERPFEEWMCAHGHSQEDVAEIYRVIDTWLQKSGVVPPPFPPPRLN